MKSSDINYLLLWIHSAFAAASVAFFLALLSSNEVTQNSTLIFIASIFFTISLIFNSLISFVLVWFKETNGVLATIFNQPKAFLLIKTAIFSFLIGLLSFLFHYSFWLVLVAILSGVISYFTLGDAFCSISESYKKAQYDNVE
jgi:nitrate reductase gamma subunit